MRAEASEQAARILRDAAAAADRLLADAKRDAEYMLVQARQEISEHWDDLSRRRPATSSPAPSAAPPARARRRPDAAVEDRAAEIVDGVVTHDPDAMGLELLD